MSLRSRFEAKVDRSGGPDACHLWTGAVNEHGYGVMRPEGKRTGPTVKAHRVAWFLETGEWPTVVRHTCDTPPCCNLRHLRDGSQADNLADMRAKGRQNRGSVNGAAKLTEESVRAIRSAVAAGASQAQMCRQYGVSRGTMSALIGGKTWQHVLTL